MSLYQYAVNERVYRNDLDYLLVRGPETSEDTKLNVLLPVKGKYEKEPTDEFRWRDGKDFSYNEAKTWCAIMLMSGSSLFLSDKLSFLNKKGLDMIYKVLQNADFHAATPDIGGKEGLPEIWRKEQTGSVYAYNFGEQAKNYVIEMQDGKYIDIFTKKIYIVKNGEITIKIDKHDCVCFYKF